jgi:hypothetical protein
LKNRFTHYLDTLSRVNGLGGGQDVNWLFYPGMLFLSPAKWWDDFGSRASVHEGVDITYFKTASGVLQQFDTTVRVPAMAGGRVLNICSDFLGKSIVTEPFGAASRPDLRVLYIYAHVVPMDHIGYGSTVSKNESIARVCSSKKNPLMPPHLHFSCIEVPRRFSRETLNWELFSAHHRIRLIHPLSV